MMIHKNHAACDVNNDHNNNDNNDNNDNNHYDGIINRIIVMNSDSGKPIYSCVVGRSCSNNTNTNNSSNYQSSDSHQIATICSIIHTLQTLSCSLLLGTKTNPPSVNNNYLQSIMIQSNDTNHDGIYDRIVFMNVPSRCTFIVLLTTTTTTKGSSNIKNVGCCHDMVDAYIRIRLEYIYTRWIMTCTDTTWSTIHHPFYYTTTHHDNNHTTNDMEQVFQQNQPFISSLFESHRGNDPQLHLHHHHSIHPASILTSGIVPASFYNHIQHNNNNNNNQYHHRLRFHISKMIQQHIHSTINTTIAGTTPSIIAALLFVHQQYITILQHTATILHGSDLLLIPSFLQRQLMSPTNSLPSLQQQHPSTTNEVWVPFCLPRLYSSGYVHCYATNIAIGRHNDEDDVANNSIEMVTSASTTTIPTVTTLCLISTIGTTEEFQLLRTISQRICQSIREDNIPLYDNIDENNNNEKYCNNNYNNIDDDDDDQDYELIASFSDVPNTLIESMNNTKSSNAIHHNLHDIRSTNHLNDIISFRSAILQTIIDGTTAPGAKSSSSSLRWEDWIQQRYLLNNASTTNNNSIVITHFVFRVNVSMVHSDKRNGGHLDNTNETSKYRKSTQQRYHGQQQRNGAYDHLVQCICSSYCDNDVTKAISRREQHQLWFMYHKLQLRLRCGSANGTEALRYFIGRDWNMRENHNDNNNSEKSRSSNARNAKTAQAIRPTTIDANCQMIVLSETLPSIDGMTYVTENDTITYFAMNGNGFELYLCAEKTKSDTISRNSDDHDDDKHDGNSPAVTSIDIISKLGANLVRQLLADVDILFISQPLTIS